MAVIPACHFRYIYFCDDIDKAKVFKPRGKVECFMKNFGINLLFVSSKRRIIHKIELGRILNKFYLEGQ